MSSVQQQHKPEQGGFIGCYGNTLGKTTLGIVEGARADILKIVESQMEGSTSGVYTIGDYGAADGATSMSLIHDVIALVRERSGDQRPVQVIYEDRHCNDFNSLFRRLHGELPDPPTYLSRFPNVFTMATATSFFQQCVPEDTMDLIVSFFAVHWLSRPLKGFKDAIFAFLDASPADQEEARRQAAEDWETFLLHRARELKAGGCLVVTVLIENTTTDRDCQKTLVVPDVSLALQRVWTGFRDEGRISQEEFEKMFVCFTYRAPRDIRAPFSDPDSAVSRAGLRLQGLQERPCPCPFLAEWEKTLEQTGVDRREAAAKKIVASARYWSQDSLRSSLRADRTDKEELLELLYQAVVDHLLAKPFRSLRNDFQVANVFIRKETLA